MSVIAIDLNTFEAGYTVYHWIEDRATGYHCPSKEDIANFVPEFCFNHKITKVMINGIPEEAHELAMQIYHTNSMSYSENNLEIEVI